LNYQKTLNFLFNQFPSYQNKGSDAFKPGLNRILDLSALANNPHEKFKSIHIAGTNGKGSCSHMLASILQESGYKVGLFTSPHLKDFRERIKINGLEIPKQNVIDFVKRFSNESESIQPSFFEYSTIMAFEYFANQKVDIAIIETGLGGRLDCSNIITPEISVITNIGLDHQQFLGNTLTEIAREKAGIIKHKIPVVIGRKQGETCSVFDFFGHQKKSELIYTESINVKYTLDLKGYYQRENSKTVLGTVKKLQEQGWQISEEAINSGFNNTIKNTGLLGRWTRLRGKPSIICDTGHNEDAVKLIVQQLNDENHENLHIVWGMVKDKDILKILNHLPQNAKYYWCSPNNERALDTKKLASEALNINLKGECFTSVLEAKEKAIQQAKREDLIFIGGSTFVVAEII
jgi:dihydrofolate synthase/folylpolyglutamate synthase